MKPSLRTLLALVGLFLSLLAGGSLAAQSSSYQPKRLNKVVELLAAKQPVWFTVADGEMDYEDGKRMAQTYADFIDYPLEHEPWDTAKLRRFMKGLVDGGPTRSGHRTPAVIVTLPLLGITETQTRSGDWMVQQALAAGAHGILFPRARNAGSVRAVLEAGRYSFHRKGVGSGGLGEGYRGSGSQRFAAQIWGVPTTEYLEKADFWPLNPNGELILAIKLEDRQALENADEVARVPGVAFAEYGQGDQTFSLVGIRPPGSPLAPEVLEARRRILQATKDAGIFFYDSRVNVDNVIERIKEGTMVARVDEATAEKGRKFTKRQMPW